MKTIFDLIKGAINTHPIGDFVTSVEIKRECKAYYQQVISAQTIAVYFTKLIKTGYLNATGTPGVYSIAMKMPEDFTVTKLDIAYMDVLREKRIKDAPALSKQIGGDHYKKYSYQPVEFSVQAKLSFIQGSIVKYIVRYEDKNGVEDIQKVIHYAELAKELKYIAKPKPYQLTYVHRFCTENKLSPLQNDVVKKAFNGDFVGIINVCKNAIKPETNE